MQIREGRIPLDRVKARYLELQEGIEILNKYTYCIHGTIAKDLDVM